MNFTEQDDKSVNHAIRPQRSEVTGNPQYAERNTTQTAAPGNPNRFLSLFQRNENGNFTPAGETYIKNIETLLIPQGYSKLILQYTNSVVFLHEASEQAIAIVLKENLPYNASTVFGNKIVPITEHKQKVLAEFEAYKRQENYTKLANVIIQDVLFMESCDYYKYSQMADYIFTRLGFGVKTNYTIEDLKSFKIRFIYDKEALKTMQEKHSPHAIPPHYEYGILFQVLNPMGYDRQIKDERTLANEAKQDSNWIDVGAVYGYTDIKKQDTVNTGLLVNPNVVNEYIADIHCSDFLTVTQDRNLLLFLLIVAKMAFVGNHIWKTPLLEKLNNPINLGSLFIDPTTNEVQKAETLDDIEQIVAKYIKSFLFTIDYTEGRASLPGIELLAKGNKESSFNYLIDTIASFTNTSKDEILAIIETEKGIIVKDPNLDPNAPRVAWSKAGAISAHAPISILQTVDCHGYFNDNTVESRDTIGNLQDTRKLNFFRLLSENNTAQGYYEYQQLLNYSTPVENKFRLIQPFKYLNGQVRPEFAVLSSTLDAYYLNLITEKLRVLDWCVDAKVPVIMIGQDTLQAQLNYLGRFNESVLAKQQNYGPVYGYGFQGYNNQGYNTYR